MIDEQDLQFAENLAKVRKILEDMKQTDETAETFLSSIDNIVKRWAEDEGSSFMRTLRENKVVESDARVMYDEFKAVQKKALDIDLQRVCLNTHVAAHGDLDLGNFIVVPKNTIIITFVNEGRVLRDTVYSNMLNRLLGFIILWIKYLNNILVYCQSAGVSMDPTQFYLLMKKFITGFVELKNAFLEKVNVTHFESDYVLTNRDVVAYYENDIIPNQFLQFANLRIAGMNTWDIFIEQYFKMGPSLYTTFTDVTDPDSPFYKIFDSMTDESGPQFDEFKQPLQPVSLSLVQVLSMMEKRLGERYPATSQTPRPINVVLLDSCRSTPVLTLKPQHSFLFKNLIPLLHKKMETYVHDRTYRKAFSEIVLRTAKSLDQKEDVFENIVQENFGILGVDQNKLKVFKKQLRLLQQKKDMSDSRKAMLKKKIYLSIYKNAREHFLKNVFMDYIAERARRMKDKVYTKSNLQKFKTAQRKKKKKTNPGKDSCDGAESDSSQDRIVERIEQRQKARLEREYEIFFDKICFHTDVEPERFFFLFYFQDVRNLDRALGNTHEIIVKKFKSKENNTSFVWLDYLDKYIPCRDESGSFIKILENRDLGVAQGEAFESPLKNYNEGDLGLNSIHRNARALQSDMFYIPSNENTRLFYDILATFRKLNLNPYKDWPLYNDKAKRREIFNKWYRLFSLYVIGNELTKTYMDVMEKTFVDLLDLGDPKVAGDISKLSEPHQSLFQMFSNSTEGFQIFLFPKYYQHFLAKDFFSHGILNKGVPYDNLDVFIYMYKRDTTHQRNESFPYLTPIEYYLANYVKVNDKSILSRAQPERDSLELKSSDYSFHQSLGLYDLGSVSRIARYLDKMLKDIDYDISSYYICDEGKKITPFKSFYKYMTDYYACYRKAVLVDGANRYQGKSYAKYLTLLSGYFVFQLDYIVTHSSQSIFAPKRIASKYQQLKTKKKPKPSKKETKTTLSAGFCSLR